MKIEGCVATVSGGASGLGEATVRELVARRARVTILDLVETSGEGLAKELGKSVIFCKTDVTNEKSVQEAVRRTMETFGAIHASINCAGVLTPGKILGKEGPIPLAKFNQVVQINLVGTMNVIRLISEQMVKNTPNEDGERGVLVNTASIAAWEGQYGQAAYAASKAGIVGMTLPIAREFAEHGIRVMTVAPGIFETPMIMGASEKVKEALLKMTLFPRRLGRPVEYARLVCHILENPMLNGDVIRLDGGVRLGAK